MTHDLTDEWLYRRDERLGILCGAGQPTDEQDELARKEASETVRELERTLTTEPM